MAGKPSLREVITALRRHQGKPAPPISRNPFHLILWEQVGYLAPDAQRRKAFTALRTEVGLDPPAILAAATETLERIAGMGGSIAVSARASRLRQSAERVIDRWGGDLRTVLKLPYQDARRALSDFPMIGEPGADKILAITKRAWLVPLDSNALRVLRRLRITSEGKDYRSTYRRAQETLAPTIPHDNAWLLAASELLRRHGQTLCRRSVPVCSRCPLALRCPSSTAH